MKIVSGFKKVIKHKLIIFDMDGVLVDACEWHRLALNMALKEVSNYEIPIEEHISEYNGLPTKIKLKKLCSRNIIHEDMFEKINSLKQQKTKDIIQDSVKVRPEKIDLLKFLKENGTHIACFTNSIRETTEIMLEKTGVLDLLELLITNQDVENPKPNPEGYIKCMKHFSIPPSKTLILEDSPNGIISATASGANVFKVENIEDVNKKFLGEIL